MNGRRVYPDESGFMHFDEGDYGADYLGRWWARAPGMKAAGNLDDHEVTEHENGTISVEPSILSYDDSYHGYLRLGVWSEA